MVLVVMTAGSQSGRSQFGAYGEPIFDSRFITFVFGISGAIKRRNPG